MRQNRFILLLLLFTLFVFSCTTSIEGARCNPDLQNCPDGYYCGSDGICHRGNPEIKDVYAVGDTRSSRDISDISMDTYKDVGDDSLDALDDVITSGDTEVISDVLSDVGCKDECSANSCKSKSILLLCKDWDNDGCKEAREVTCGDNSECINGECVCIVPYKDCDSDMSNGCESNIQENPSTCGSCSNNCGDNSLCRNGICGCISPFGNCNGRWSDGCEVDLSSDNNNCGECNKDCGINSRCNNGNCECLPGFADCDSVKGCEINLNSPTTCGSTCQNYINCGQNSVCNNGFCACKSGYANCVNGWIDGCEVDILKDINNCGECNHRCQPRNVNNPICNNGECDYDLCKMHYLDKDQNRENGCEYWSDFPKRYRYSGDGDELPAVIIDTDNGYILGGNVVNKGIWILNIDNNGEILWQKSIKLNGEAQLKSALTLRNENGAISGYIFAGTNKNDNRTDLFLLRISPTGLFQESKSYVVLESSYGFDVTAILPSKDKDLFFILGSFEKQPMFMSVSGDFSLKRAVYYQYHSLPIYGLFRGGVVQRSGNELILTGDTWQPQIEPSFKSLLYLSVAIDGNVNDIAYYTEVGKNYTGSSVTEIDADRLYAIAGSVETQSGKSGMIYMYNYSSRKWDKIVKVNISSSLGVVLNSSFKYVWKSKFQADTILYGGEVNISSDNNDALFGTLPVGLNSIGGVVAIGLNKDESTMAAVYRDNLLFASPTNSYSSDVDMMVVRLREDLTIPDAVCEASFYKPLQGGIESLNNPNLQKNFPEVYDIANITIMDNLDSYANAIGSAINICSEPLNP